MSELLPGNTTLGDLCTAALQESGRLGVGQTALAEDINKAWSRAQWMLQEWERKRWLVYHLVTYSKVATGQISYTFGPNGEINTNSAAAWGLEALTPTGGAGFAVNDTIGVVGTPPLGTGTVNGQVTVLAVSGGLPTSVSITVPGAYTGPLSNTFTQGVTSGAGAGGTFSFPTWGLLAARTPLASGSVRPPKIESAFLRQIQNSQPNQVDYPMQILQSMEDYNRIALKSLQSFPGAVFLDSQWPLSTLFCYPVPQASIYSINVSVMEQLPAQFLTLASVVNLPYEYYSCILYNLALRLRSTFSIPSFPGDELPALAKNALNVVRGPNTQIARLVMPEQLTRPGIYNIFSDRDY